MRTRGNKNILGKINQAKNWLFEKSNRIDKPQANLIKKTNEELQIINSRNIKGI